MDRVGGGVTTAREQRASGEQATGGAAERQSGGAMERWIGCDAWCRAWMSTVTGARQLVLATAALIGAPELGPIKKGPRGAADPAPPVVPRLLSAFYTSHSLHHGDGDRRHIEVGPSVSFVSMGLAVRSIIRAVRPGRRRLLLSPELLYCLCLLLLRPVPPPRRRLSYQPSTRLASSKKHPESITIAETRSQRCAVDPGRTVGHA
ncbi:uncharacterized protein BDZ99DRAFT_527052 [Mytilinidion resinicola]|uniref:Uncharacterized protein n=1 Tax=Mytilinidion resinicola TaxID=574789 RepID=A0A6A6Y2U1_9PEZI|nr:uncharacterized protein BDZ99DRAFT_527052 [Mytilinidion resinicola]KAF2802959.1 hypothetical protein BDZ99DRAFT_527052 [Mytilinidion resinicola]